MSLNILFHDTILTLLYLGDTNDGFRVNYNQKYLSAGRSLQLSDKQLCTVEITYNSQIISKSVENVLCRGYKSYDSITTDYSDIDSDDWST